MEAFSPRIVSEDPKALQRVHLVKAEDRVVIDRVRVVDGTGAAPQEQMSVLVEQGRIKWVGPSQAKPQGLDGAKLIAAEGKTLLPGLMDCHIHFTGEVSSNAYRRYLDPSPQVKLLRAANDAYTVLSTGFTTVREAGTPGGIAFALRAAIRDGVIAGPRIHAAGTPLTQTNGHGDWHVFPYDWVKSLTPRAWLVDGVDECRKAVRRNFRDGSDFIKVFLASGGITNTPEDLLTYPEFSPEEVRAIVEEAHRREKKVVAHAVGAPSVLHALDGGVDSIEHGVFGPDQRILERMAKAGVYLCPTMSIFYWVATEGAKWGVFAGGIEAAKAIVDSQFAMVRAARELGVKMINGTDCVNAMTVGRLAKELELMVMGGLTPLEAIVAATRSAAEAMDMQDDLGTIAPGKRADLLLVDGDPTADIRVLQNLDAISLVMKAADA